MKLFRWFSCNVLRLHAHARIVQFVNTDIVKCRCEDCGKLFTIDTSPV